ncbi:MAG: AcrR family transcriptional regulator [Arcticibacterium sp.]|jgi:AcrR family transcriptional regulator
MGVADRKERERAELRSKILEAAKKLFLEEGFEKTSIRNIAELIEYSPGTIYLYFKDKNELLFELHVEAFQALILALSNILLAENAVDRLEHMGNNYIKFAFENPELYNLMFIMEAPMETLECNNEIWDDGMKAFELLRYLVTDCQKEGYLSSYDLDDASLMIWSFVHGLVTLKSRKRLEMFSEKDDVSLARMMRAYKIFVENLKCSYEEPKTT